MTTIDAPAKGWHREDYILLAAMLAALLVFALDFLTPDGMAHGMSSGAQAEQSAKAAPATG